MKQKQRGVSLSSKDATRGVGVGPGRANIVKAEFDMYNYGGNRKPVPACLVTYERGGEEVGTEPYTVGSGWKISDDGQSLIPKAGQTGLPDSCKFMHLIRSLESNGMPTDFLTCPNDLVGIEGDLILKPLPKIQDKGKSDTGREPSVLIFEEDSISDAPWEEGGKSKSKAKVKSKSKSDSDDDEDDEDQDDDQDDSDDDDEEPPARKSKATAKSKSKSKANDDDDPDDDDDDDDSDDEGADEDVDEQAAEALIEALEDGDLKLAKVAAAVAAQLKGNKQGKAIAARAADPKFLKKELGWEFDGKLVSKT